jgi:Pretoxin HINT domain
MRWRLLVVCAVSVGSLTFTLSWHRTAVARAPRALSAAEKSAAQFLHRALTAEAEGNLDQRATYLREALDAAPDYAPVHWQLGELQVDGTWLPAEAGARLLTSEGKLSRYRAARDAAGESAVEQIRLARWCAREGLLPQEQLHLAKALEKEPTKTQTREIMSRLGLVRHDDQLMPVAQAESRKQQARQAEAALQSWKVRLGRWREELESKYPVRRAAGEQKLTAVRDPAAAGPIEKLLGAADRPLALVAVRTLAAINDSRSTDALARLALDSRDEQIRTAAAEALRDRDIFTYAPQMLDKVKPLVEVRSESTTDATGGLRQRVTLFREGRLANELLVLNHIERPQNAADMGQDSMQARKSTVAAVKPDLNDFLNSAREDRRLANEALKENEESEQNNERVTIALRLATNNPDLRNEPKELWDWWDNYNEMHYAQDKQTYESLRNVTMQTFRTRSSCFVPGTKVWTNTGAVAIEKVQAGDFVLSQNVETGELSYKPVSATTVGTPLPLVEIRAGGEQIRCTFGHLFWVSGTGWQMAKELKVGQLLYTARGPLMIDGVEKTGEARCHNLIVPDFNTYFVTDQQVLVHDINVRGPTTVIVPGLVQN